MTGGAGPGRIPSGHNAGISERLSETIRLPQPWLGVLVGYGALATAGLTLLWSVVSLTATQRLVLGGVLAWSAILLLGGPLWFIAMHTSVDDRMVRRRVGHRRRRVALTDVLGIRIERSGGPFRLDRLVLSLVDGSEYTVTTRRAQELAAAVQPWRAPRMVEESS